MFKAARDETRNFVALGIAIVVVSDTRTLETDTAGALLVELIEADGHRSAGRVVVPDEIDAIRNTVLALVERQDVQLVLTTGGTGFSGRDVTPEAVEPLFDKRMEGFSVLFHQYSASTIGTSSIQSRATAGLIGETFVFCLPGSRGACRDAWEAILTHQFDYRHSPCNFVELMPRLLDR